ncbi:protein SULFUR DEFICIENCY-INDUCED 1 isoform X3 [Cryptomeria japonica]|uniref:protein SULFUR DEFICIENCY-INDUCED 1 isoform X3 n=1 Tax=Cryptomeria japonica TaxID=3369 RepID=UPI0027DA1E35|nr:protein SULFUR DEFICIENCY-INDUCED 1 isoform X3 [Cryptomeria japonica]
MLARDKSSAGMKEFGIKHKVPVGDTPYIRAKQVQLVEKNPEAAIALFWAAINAGDRVESALKDMAIVMKQLGRADEAIEAIKSFRHRCSLQAQESLDNVLLDLYKKCGRVDDQIVLLKEKLRLIQHGLAFNGNPTKTSRSHGKKFQLSIKEETSRILSNLGWAYMQQNNYVAAEVVYRCMPNEARKVRGGNCSIKGCQSSE